jgi:RecB family exonuclease
MGSQVHVCLEKLYNERLSLTNLRRLYDEKFPDKLPENVFIVRKDEYRENGGRLLSDYYREFYETDDSLTLDTEHKVKGEIAGKKFIGYIDRLSISEDLNNPIIFINDYKTGKTIKKLKNDLQAKIYTKLLKDKINLPIINKWYYLRYLKCEEIEFSDDQLKEGEEQIKDIIDRIESEKKFKRKKSPLCQWCEMREICEKDE